MANGDIALAGGLPVLDPATHKVKDGADAINETRDLIANEAAARAAADTTLTTAVAAKLTKTTSEYNADFAFRDTLIGAAQATADQAKDGQMTTNVYNRLISGTRRALWVETTGNIGYASSSQRYKTNIEPFDITDEQIAVLSVVSFHNLAGLVEVGLIAEALVDAGLGWAVFYDDDERPEGINYELVGVALIPAMQRLISRVAALEDAQ